MTHPTPKLLLIDFSSETNIGDIALQEGLIRLVRHHFPHAEMAVTTVFGANQNLEGGRHFTELMRHPDIEVAGSLRPTFYPLDRDGGVDPVLIEIKNVAGAGAALVLLLSLRVSRRLAPRLLPRAFSRTCRLIEDADVVIWKGKNFRGTHWLIEPYRVLSRLYMPMVCLLFGKPLFNVGSSLWPLNNPLSTVLLRAVLKRCAHVSVRESASLVQIGQLFARCDAPPPVDCYPDLSFAVLGEAAGPTMPEARRAGEGMRVALTLMDWTGSGHDARERYIAGMAALAEHLTSAHDAFIRIVPQVVKGWEAADYIVERLLSAVAEPTRGRITVVPSAPGIEGVLDHYRDVDYLIATRMHSAIFALSVGTPVIAIAYDKGAKWNILTDLGYGDFLLAYDEVTTAALIERFEALRTNRSTVMKRVSEAIAHSRKRVEDNVVVIRQVGLPEPIPHSQLPHAVRA